MLKAVYLDEKEHQYLIDFISSYKDENNKANISSAIRFLMMKGYQSLYGTKAVNVPPYHKTKINTEEIKKDILSSVNQNLKDEINNVIQNEVNTRLNNQLMENNSQLMNTLINLVSVLPRSPQPVQQPIIQQQPVISQVPVQQASPTQNVVNEPEQIIEKKSVPITTVPMIKKKSNVGGLLGNLLSNANR